MDELADQSTPHVEVDAVQPQLESMQPEIQSIEHASRIRHAPLSESFWGDENDEEPTERLDTQDLGKGKATVPGEVQLQGSSGPALAKVFVNTLHRRERVLGALRSYVHHTREWIPRSFAREPRKVAKKNPNPPQTGFCGQLSRLHPPP